MTILNVFHAKCKPNLIQYKDFNQLDNILFRIDLLLKLAFQNVQSDELEKFIHILSKVLNGYTTTKKKTLQFYRSSTRASLYQSKAL